ncbi:hypothetical protein J2T55_001838 [Methylohalomonas lacus]|uniref:Restriction endonuclease type IV Mrr domain-containing protein n=1 Tax=Methylohalomonas lacus TaxID=398773 RepID=A0AAE3L211_9GAMM|nr:restriction endonuclease [Methylohalomonas lacus]MCS3903806.1 hypothetical protein [Methylohalomonas lacus]
MHWRDFERYLIEAYRRQGYQVLQNPFGVDAGVDLVLRRALEKDYVQFKHWDSRRLGVSVVRELYACVTAGQADGGFVVASGHFSRAAKSFAAATPVQLVDGAQLVQLIGPVCADIEQNLLRPAAAEAIDPLHDAPECPVCGRSMVRRRARGRYAGSQFWGCAAFPACQGPGIWIEDGALKHGLNRRKLELHL